LDTRTGSPCFSMTTSETRITSIIANQSQKCAMNYFANFRPVGFQAQERDLGTTHIGIRVAYVIN